MADEDLRYRVFADGNEVVKIERWYLYEKNTVIRRK